MKCVRVEKARNKSKLIVFIFLRLSGDLIGFGVDVSVDQN
jgi:hypothetical protein